MPEPRSFAAHRRNSPWISRATWPFAWIAGRDVPPTVGAYRLRFRLERPARLRLVATADERYRLFLDGVHLRSGPEIGSRWRWQADAITVEVEAGEHLLLATVWSVGAQDGDFATDGICHGFALGVDGPENALLATGTAPWEWHALTGYALHKSRLAHWTVPDVERDAVATDWQVEAGGGSGWIPARTFSAVHHVADVEAYPARLVEVGELPPPLHQPWTRATARHAQELQAGADPGATPLGDDDPQWRTAAARMLSGEAALEVPAGRTVRCIIDCNDYLTAWPELCAGGHGALVRLEWMEALSRKPVAGARLDKGRRDEIAGRFVGGLGDTMHGDDEERTWRPLYWRSGRFVILTITAGTAPARVSRLTLVEDRYPLKQESSLQVGDAGLQRALPLCLRTMQCNAHDQFSDTPYYERMQYLGDCRLDCLTAYVLTRDVRLIEKALRMADAQRLPHGLTVSRAPTRNLQVIPTWSLAYVGMVRDHLWWHGARELVAGLMPGVRGVLDGILRHRAADGTLGCVPGWNFCDWTASFHSGEPPGSDTGSGPANLHLLTALQWAEDLESALGERELAARWRRLRREMAPAIAKVFWDARRRRFSDDRAHTSHSQHVQAMAALALALPARLRRAAVEAIDADPTAAPASLYFTHYLIEAWAWAGCDERIRQAFGFWAALPEQGFVTLPEEPEPSRSDCHAWCSHPLFHVAATIAGIRPDAPGFARVRIAPCLGAIPSVRVKIPHPGGGWIAADLKARNGALRGEITLPPGVGGTLHWHGTVRKLRPGRQRVAITR
jgi:alpha-L-rhamnosidase